MKRIVLTGGGTAGHVTPNIALIPALKKAGYNISYIGSLNGIEKTLTAEEGIPYYGISSGKLRRYFSLKNISDPFRVLRGYRQALKILKQLDPHIVFSKGGFVSVPVVYAASKLGIPVIIHESDMTPGLANRLSFEKATAICATFPETLSHLPKEKAHLTGSPIRAELFEGDAGIGRIYANISKDAPIILVIGGSTGSVFINKMIRANLETLLTRYNIIHICGKGKVDHEYDNIDGYVQHDYIGSALPDVLAASDIVISRAGANTICELLALKKPNLLIPLSKAASRGDQILNAKSFEKQGFSVVLEEESLIDELLVTSIDDLYQNREKYIDAMAKNNETDAISEIIKLIKQSQKYYSPS